MDPKKNRDLEELFNKLGNIHRSITEFEFLPTAEMIALRVMSKSESSGRVFFDNRVVTPKNFYKLQKRWQTQRPNWYHHLLDLNYAEGVLRYCELLVDITHNFWNLSEQLNVRSKVINDAVLRNIIERPVTNTKINSIKNYLSKKVNQLNNVVNEWLTLIIEKQVNAQGLETGTQPLFKPMLETDDKSVFESKPESVSKPWNRAKALIRWPWYRHKSIDNEPNVRPKKKPVPRSEFYVDIDELSGHQSSQQKSDFPEFTPSVPQRVSPSPPIFHTIKSARDKSNVSPDTSPTIPTQSRSLLPGRIIINISHDKCEDFLKTKPRNEFGGFAFLPNRLDLLESCCDLRYVSEKRIVGKSDDWMSGEWQRTHPQWVHDLNRLKHSNGRLEYCHTLLDLCKELPPLIIDIRTRGEGQSDISRLVNECKLNRSVEIVRDMLKLDYEQIVLLLAQFLKEFGFFKSDSKSWFNWVGLP